VAQPPKNWGNNARKTKKRKRGGRGESGGVKNSQENMRKQRDQKRSTLKKRADSWDVEYNLFPMGGKGKTTGVGIDSEMDVAHGA